MRLLSGFFLLASIPVLCHAQDKPLSLNEAIQLAKDRNGTIKTAIFNVRAARARVGQSFSAFLPTVTPSYIYNSSRQEIATGSNQQFVQTEGGITQVAVGLRILDSGSRDFTYRSSQRSYRSQIATSQQTYRTELFSVISQFYEALRAQQLQQVSEQQVNEYTTILKSIKAGIIARNNAPIEELQANADLQNARVKALTAKNRTATTRATLKGKIGWDNSGQLPTLAEIDAEPTASAPPELDSLIKEGLTNRPDLVSSRLSIQSQEFTVRNLNRDAWGTFALDFSFAEQVSPTNLQNRSLIFSASIPLFDGGQRRQAVNEGKAQLLAFRSTLIQAERDARAEIESTYAEFTQNSERLEAAKVARDASEENYKAAIASQKLGSYTLLQALTAQTSYVTAKSSYIEAEYDYLISQAKLALVTGRPIAGEELGGAVK